MTRQCLASRSHGADFVVGNQAFDELAFAEAILNVCRAVEYEFRHKIEASQMVKERGTKKMFASANTQRQMNSEFRTICMVDHVVATFAATAELLETIDKDTAIEERVYGICVYLHFGGGW